jgi:AraC-like DNA-binding protein
MTGGPAVALSLDRPPEEKFGIYVAAEHELERNQQLTLGSYRGNEFAIGTHRRDRPGLGLTVPTPLIEAYLVVVQLRPGGWCDMHRDAGYDGGGELRRGSVSIFDLRQLWVAELQHPFHSFSFVIPRAMFDALADDLGRRKIGELRCPVSSEVQDRALLNLARAMYPALVKPQKMSALTLTELFEVACVHLARDYGGLDIASLSSTPGLVACQMRRVKEMMADNLHADPTLDDLGRELDMSACRFAKAFRISTGMRPHEWLTERRLASAMNLLASTTRSNRSIAAFCGFGDASHLNDAFVSRVGVAPERWRSIRRQ